MFLTTSYYNSTGPLIKTGTTEQVGIHSFGTDPCETYIPSVYTDVQTFSDWLDERLKDEDGAEYYKLWNGMLVSFALYVLTQ